METSAKDTRPGKTYQEAFQESTNLSIYVTVLLIPIYLHLILSAGCIAISLT